MSVVAVWTADWLPFQGAFCKALHQEALESEEYHENRQRANDGKPRQTGSSL